MDKDREDRFIMDEDDIQKISLDQAKELRDKTMKEANELIKKQKEKENE